MASLRSSEHGCYKNARGVGNGERKSGNEYSAVSFAKIQNGRKDETRGAYHSGSAGVGEGGVVIYQYTRKKFAKIP